MASSGLHGGSSSKWQAHLCAAAMRTNTIVHRIVLPSAKVYCHTLMCTSMYCCCTDCCTAGPRGRTPTWPWRTRLNWLPTCRWAVQLFLLAMDVKGWIVLVKLKFMGRDDVTGARLSISRIFPIHSMYQSTSHVGMPLAIRSTSHHPFSLISSFPLLHHSSHTTSSHNHHPTISNNPQDYGLTKEALRRYDVCRRPRWRHVMQLTLAQGASTTTGITVTHGFLDYTQVQWVLVLLTVYLRICIPVYLL